MAIGTLMDMLSGRVTDDPVATLFHYACGHALDWKDEPGGEICWRRDTHRGVQWLDKVVFPKSQRRYIFSPKFEVKFDSAFEATIRGCAAQERGEPTWISEDYIRAMVGLHEMGFAHSFETWQEGRLVGGAFGVQLGSMMTCDSMFHTVSNASKAAWGQTLVRLGERGYRVVDTNGVAQHQVEYGEEWVRQGVFERLILDCLGERRTLFDGARSPDLPGAVALMLRLVRLRRRLRRGG